MHKFLTVYQGKIEVPHFMETAEGIGIKIGDFLKPVTQVPEFSASSDHINHQQGTIGGSGGDKLSSLKAVDVKKDTVVDEASKNEMDAVGEREPELEPAYSAATSGTNVRISDDASFISAAVNKNNSAQDVSVSFTDQEMAADVRVPGRDS